MEYILCAFMLLFAGSLGQEIPDLPDYFVGSVEYNTIVKDAGFKQSNITRDYFDRSVGLARSDIAADTLNPDDMGTVTSIVDPSRKVQYFIYPEHKNCTVKPLVIPAGGGGIVVNPDGTYSFGSMENIFFLVNASEYKYTGNSSAHGINLDNWSFTGDVDLPGGLVYRNLTLGLSIAEAGTPSIHGTNPDPVPWRLSLDGTVSTPTYNVTVSTVIRYFDLSFTRPNFDVFDISLCLELKDYVEILMSIPKGPNNMVDYSTFTANLRKSIVDYTGLDPIQVGNIQIASTGGDELFTSLQLSNITAIATNVGTPMTAQAAYNKIALNINNGLFPFQIDIGYGNMVTPKEIEVQEFNGNHTMPTPSATTEPVPDPSMMPSSSATTEPVPDPSMMPSSSSTTEPVPDPSMMPSSSSTMMPSPTVTTTVTVTVMPSACPSVPAQPPTSSAYPCPTPVLPPSTGKSYSKSYVAGLAFGMIILGAAVGVLVLLVLLFVFTRCKRISMRTGYERQVNVDE